MLTGRLPHLAPVVVVVAGIDNPNPSTYIFFAQVNEKPPIVGIGIKRKRYTYDLIKKHHEFSVNFLGSNILSEVDKAGMMSGHMGNKQEKLAFHYDQGHTIKTPVIRESILAYEVKYMDEAAFPDHQWIYGEVTNIRASYDLKDNPQGLKPVLASFYSLTYHLPGALAGKWGFSR